MSYDVVEGIDEDRSSSVLTAIYFAKFCIPHQSRMPALWKGKRRGGVDWWGGVGQEIEYTNKCLASLIKCEEGTQRVSWFKPRILVTKAASIEYMMMI